MSTVVRGNLPLRFKSPQGAVLALVMALALTACVANAVRPPDPARITGFSPWSGDGVEYRLGPGDDVEIKLPFNAGYNDRVLVGPDGRFTLPLIGDVQAEGRTIRQLTDELNRRFSRDLADPRVQVAIRAYASQKVFVGGEVNNPGLYTMPGRIGVMEAILMANGFQDTARTSEVVLIRRGAEGRPMSRTIDVPAFVEGKAADVPLQAFDVVFVPKSTIAEVDQFVDQFINRVVPFQRGFTYTMGRTQTVQ
jgi:polysaccharide biosynthesis/export protein PslD